jgi:L-ribulose-5-phosphate 3-epimerase
MKFRFGIRAHDMAHLTNIDYLCSTIANLGISNLQLVMNKALADSSYDEANIKKIAATVKRNGQRICMLGAYFNPVHPDQAEVKKGIENFKANLRIMNAVGASFVGSETGSFNGSPWTYLPANHTLQAHEAVRKIFAELASEAEKDQAQIAIEPAWAHVIYSVPELQKLVRELNSPRVHVTIDLFNLLYEGNFESRDEIFLQALRTFGPEVKIIHLKDAVIQDGKMVQTAPGEGKFNYPLMLKAIAEFCPEAYLVFEGVKPERIKESFAYLKKLAEEI